MTELTDIHNQIDKLEQLVTDDYPCWLPVFAEYATRCFYEMRRLLNLNYFVTGLDPTFEWIDATTFQFTLKAEGEGDGVR